MTVKKPAISGTAAGAAMTEATSNRCIMTFMDFSVVPWMLCQQLLKTASYLVVKRQVQMTIHAAGSWS